MAKVVEKERVPDLYERDYYAWLEEQALLLREGRIEDIDVAHLLEEIDDLVSGEKATVESHAATIIEHLLKLQLSPASRPRRGWRLAVAKARARLERRLTASLRRHLVQRLPELYPAARREAAIGLEVDRIAPAELPTECPYTLEQILDPDWLPSNRHGLDDAPSSGPE